MSSSRAPRRDTARVVDRSSIQNPSGAGGQREAVASVDGTSDSLGRDDDQGPRRLRLMKLGVRDRAAAIVEAFDAGVVTPRVS
ncbi:MAG: hypothetical protein AB8G26_06200 [Ilumatobacter sp.]